MTMYRLQYAHNALRRFVEKHLLYLFIFVKIAHDDILEVLSAELPQYPRLANLTSATQNQRLTIWRILPLNQLMLYASFHCINYPNKQL